MFQQKIYLCVVNLFVDKYIIGIYGNLMIKSNYLYIKYKKVYKIMGKVKLLEYRINCIEVRES